MFSDISDSERADTFRNFVPTSKAQLCQFSLLASGGDIAKAREIYDFYAERLNLPDVEPVQPSRMESIKAGAADIFGFVRDNQNDIINAISFVRSLFNRNAAAPIAQQVAEALPKIN